MITAGTWLGPYEIVDLLGAGGMGEVYRARDPRLGREVAIKVLPSEVASDSARLSLFEREARAVAALNHPNILTVHDVGTHDGTPYVVTELLEGETLRELVSRRVPTTSQILSYMLQAARGLEAAHAKGIVHRDLKPENIFLTTDGRVKVLDFGLAKLVQAEVDITSDVSTAAHSTPPGKVAGTVLYMSPEQARAQTIDVRSDVFSFGVVLHELLAGKHPFRKDTLAGTLTAIVEETPVDLGSLGRGIPPAVAGIVRRCLEKAREDRYASGHDVAMVLEAVLAAPSGTRALEEVEERSPYPGLSSFTERDAAVFFGREREVEALWGRIRNRRLLAVIGPSGAGKTSFVRAGVLPARPDGWAVLACTPGRAPRRALARALAPELAGDPEALTALPDFEDEDVALSLLRRWRTPHAEALLVLDQFEELFTLGSDEEQQRFAALLGRLAAEVDIHVLLSLRDDFLMKCHDRELLAPVFSELTPLGPLTPEGLRRAVVEPAKKRGYRFEDEALVEEMVESVEGVRAALPLLAFAVSRLWEKRDREGKVLTRAAYEEIGGVAGALAQHAEQTLDRIGSERHGMVREIFRNLVTSQSTRAVAGREELLSVFSKRDAAEEVLGQLIDARLLTSYEVEDPDRHSERGVVENRAKNLSVGTTHRIEIVHESLLKAWPRLVRWQTQDEEGALLRDQLKQAAHVWEEKGRSPDVLWSGTALREYELWRERYAGKLTVAEESFASAMVERDRRRRRWRRAVVTALVAGLATVAVVVSVSRQEALRQARLAEAAEIVALGRTELVKNPTAALAFARKSLEVVDTPGARRLAVAALWEAPPHRILPERSGFRGAFSPDGRYLAAASFSENIRLFPQDGGDSLALAGFMQPNGPSLLAFAESGDSLLASADFVHFRSVSVPEGRELQSFRLEPAGAQALGLTAGPHGYFGGLLIGPSDGRLVSQVIEWPYDGTSPVVRGTFAEATAAFDPIHSRVAFVRDRQVLLRPFTGSAQGEERPIGSLAPGDRLTWASMVFSPAGDRLAAGDSSGRLAVWPTDPQADGAAHELHMDDPEGMFPPVFGPTGRHVAWGSSTNHAVSVWDLEGPPGAEPRVLRRPDRGLTKHGVFHPLGQWLAVLPGSPSFWRVGSRRAYVLSGHRELVSALGFTPDSSRLVSCGADGAFVWPTSPEVAPRPTSFPTQGWCYGHPLSFTPDGREFLDCYFGAHLQPLDGGEGRWIQPTALSAEDIAGGCVIDPEGRRAATATQAARPPATKQLRVFDLESGEILQSWPLVPEGEVDEGFVWGATGVAFSGERVLVPGHGGVRSFDLLTGEVSWLWRAPRALLAASRDGRQLLLAGGEARNVADFGRKPTRVSFLDLDGDETAITTHGVGVSSVAVGPEGRVIATGDVEGIVRVGWADGSEPHLLTGHAATVEKLVISPDLRWVASKSGTEVRLWPMPDLSKAPFHTLPYDELVARLRSFTNLEVVEDEASSTGYRLEVGPFPGWKDVPTW